MPRTSTAAAAQLVFFTDRKALRSCPPPLALCRCGSREAAFSLSLSHAHARAQKEERLLLIPQFLTLRGSGSGGGTDGGKEVVRAGAELREREGLLLLSRPDT